MMKVEEIRRGLWTFPIVLPDNPLKWLNCYVIKSEKGGRNLLIDTGFNRTECQDALQEGMTCLGLEPEMTDVLFTHMHADHIGNAAFLQKMGCNLYMGEVDNSTLIRTYEIENNPMHSRALKEGIPESMMTAMVKDNPGTLYKAEPFEAFLLKDAQVLSYGEYSLECILTPGHTPGHLCLYDTKSKTMFLGDHVLFDITPNICIWPELDDALGSYMNSLERIYCYDVDHALPAHRNQANTSMRMRIDQLLLHHHRRLSEAKKIIGDNPGINAYQLAGLMTWEIRTKNWEEFPLGQKWFAFSEALAHLDHLVNKHRIEKTITNGIASYRSIK